MSKAKINVLIVDDHPEWWNSFEARSKTWPDSFVNIQTSSTFAAGLAKLSSDKNIDIVLVDLHLDNNLNAFEFIDEARKRGTFLPFAITSQQAKRSALRNTRIMDQYVRSHATDYIEKREVKKLSILQSRIRTRLNEFLSAVRGLLHTSVSRQLEADERLYLLHQQVTWHTHLLTSYSRRVKLGSYDRICTNLRAIAKQCEATSQDSLRADPRTY